MANVIIRVFQANNQDDIDLAEGKLNGLGFSVTRLNNVEDLNVVDDTQISPIHSEFEDVVVLVATMD